MKSTPITYSVIARNPNSGIDPTTGIPEVLARCGHNHKSYATAKACYDRLTAWRDNTTSGTWYRAHIEDSTGHKIDCAGRQIPTTAQERRAAEFAEYYSL